MLVKLKMKYKLILQIYLKVLEWKIVIDINYMVLVNIIS